MNLKYDEVLAIVSKAKPLPPPECVVDAVFDAWFGDLKLEEKKE